MLFHEALRHILTTFSHQVLQQGSLTNYLADCGVFEPYDPRKYLCQLLDQHYFRRMYDCLSRSPYKHQYDAIMQEFIAAHPQFAPDQVQYIFDSVRFAYGKIQRIKLPKEPELFPQPKVKKKISKRPSNTYSPHTAHRNAPSIGGRRQLHRRAPQAHRSTYVHPKPRPKSRYNQQQNTQLPNSIQWKLLLKSICFGVGQILLYIVLVYCLVGGFIFLTEERWYGIVGWLIGGIILYILHRKYNP